MEGKREGDLIGPSTWLQIAAERQVALQEE